MIIRIEASGASFLGAGKYYLHDKLDAERAARTADGERIAMRDQSDERVWFTDTRNCLNIDPERALEEMWHTAEDQAQLKMQAGVARGGRKCEDPVKTITLSWHKDDQPTPEHMVASADAFLKHMGWEGHQAVFVGHRDTEHRHIHIVLNRIHPETGRTIDDYKERKRAQVWALSYEKENDNVRCEERELRAAKREHRAPNFGTSNEYAPGNDHAPTQQPSRTPANDHLPHNVIMLSRPLEREYNAQEQRKAALDEHERGALKAHQEAERKAHFKDGAKLFKAARHAAYDEVRQAYKPEWRQFYKDAHQAGFTAKFAQNSAVKDAIDLAGTGRWQEARERFDARDDVRSELLDQFAMRKADIEERQKADIAERQRDVCDALRLVREVQYQELLQRQRNERAAWTASTSLETLGITSPASQTQKAELPANQNQVATPSLAQTTQPAPEQQQAAVAPPTPIEQGQLALMQDMVAAVDNAISEQKGEAIRVPAIDATPAVTHQLTDLAAGGIGQVASYIADQLGEMFAPTPPEVREAQAAAQAKRDTEQRAQQRSLDDKTAAYARMIDAAVKVIETERAAGADEQFWKERDRGKVWERDR